MLRLKDHCSLARAEEIFILAFAFALIGILVGCSDNPNATEDRLPGILLTTTSTTGDSLDPDGYTVSVDGGSSQAVGINDTATFADLSAGDHSVELSDVASNCTVSDANPRTVTVPEDDTASTTFSVSCEATPDNGTASNQIVVDPDNPAWLTYENGAPFFTVGPGGPEGFLYLGTKEDDGTRSGGDQDAIIQELIDNGGNAIYMHAVRSHGGDGTSDENPFVNEDPSQGVNQDILDQWESWFQTMDDAGILIYLFFYDDSADPFGGDTVSSDEFAYLNALVDTFGHHDHLIWMIAEEYSEALSDTRASNIAFHVRDRDPNDHPIGIHTRAPSAGGTFPSDPNIEIHGYQSHASSVDDLHSEIAGEFTADHVTMMVEWGKSGSSTPHGTLSESETRQGNWASIMGGSSGVMVFGWYENEDPTANELNQSRFARDFMEATRYQEMEPDDSRAFGSTEWVLATDANSYILYTRQGDSDPGLTNMEAGTYDLLWLDTVSGEQVQQNSVDVDAGDQTWTPPSIIGNELALYIQSSNG